MNRVPVERVLQSPAPSTPQAVGALLADQSTVFWVDWRAEDEEVVESCEGVLRTRELRAELVETGTTEGYDIYIEYRTQRVRVPLTYSVEDRHVTLCTLNQVLAPEYEIRFCADSGGSDTLAFVPLASADWEDLERRYGAQVRRHFPVLVPSHNPFS